MPPFTFTALGTVWWIEIFTPITDERRSILERDVAALLRSIEERFSRFLPQSFVSRLNREKTIADADNDCILLLTIGKQFFTDTTGIFNIALGGHLRSRGYDELYTFSPTDTTPTTGNPLTDIDVYGTTVTLTADCEIDLGGLGKGWAIDQIASLLQSQAIHEFLINGGGDIFATSEKNAPIVIYLEHPLEKKTYLGSTPLLHRGFAASSPHTRSWTANNTAYNHIVGTIQSDASFITAPTAMIADMLATTALIAPTPLLESLCYRYNATIARYHNATATMESYNGFVITPIT